VFSPHPDDDVISAGGILRKLHQNENDITVAYQTSGNIAVFDHEVRRYLDFLRRTAADFAYGNERLEPLLSGVERFLGARRPGEVDSDDVLMLKRRIREMEAVSGIETLGLAADQARFLNLPFYQTGQVRKDPIGEPDIGIVLEALEEIRPQIALVAGDLSIRTAPIACARKRWIARSSAIPARRPRCGSIAAPGRNGRWPRPIC